MMTQFGARSTNCGEHSHLLERAYASICLRRARTHICAARRLFGVCAERSAHTLSLGRTHTRRARRRRAPTSCVSDRNRCELITRAKYTHEQRACSPYAPSECVCVVWAFTSEHSTSRARSRACHKRVVGARCLCVRVKDVEKSHFLLAHGGATIMCCIHYVVCCDIYIARHIHAQYIRYLLK